jgi:hypothetical protein
MKSREGMSGFLSAFESWQVLMKNHPCWVTDVLT